MGGVHASNPALWSQKQVDFCDFKASLDYGVSPKTARAVQRNPVSKQTNKTKQNKIKKKQGGEEKESHT